MLRRTAGHRRVHRPASQMRHLANSPGHVEDRWRGIALRAERAISAPARMVFTDVVFTGEGVLKVAGALVDRRTLRAATLSFMHAGSHVSLAFHYGTKGSTNPTHQYTKVTKIFITISGYPIQLPSYLSRSGITPHESSRCSGFAPETSSKTSERSRQSGRI